MADGGREENRLVEDKKYRLSIDPGLLSVQMGGGLKTGNEGRGDGENPRVFSGLDGDKLHSPNRFGDSWGSPLSSLALLLTSISVYHALVC